MYTIVAADEAVKKVISTDAGEEDSYCLQFMTRRVHRLYPGGKSSCSGKREAEQGVTAPLFWGSELDKCVSQFEIIRMIQAHFIMIIALHRHSIGGVAYLHLTICETFPAKITV